MANFQFWIFTLTAVFKKRCKRLLVQVKLHLRIESNCCYILQETNHTGFPLLKANKRHNFFSICYSQLLQKVVNALQQINQIWKFFFIKSFKNFEPYRIADGLKNKNRQLTLSRVNVMLNIFWKFSFSSLIYSFLSTNKQPRQLLSFHL